VIRSISKTIRVMLRWLQIIARVVYVTHTVNREYPHDDSQSDFQKVRVPMFHLTVSQVSLFQSSSGSLRFAIGIIALSTCEFVAYCEKFNWRLVHSQWTCRLYHSYLEFERLLCCHCIPFIQELSFFFINSILPCLIPCKGSEWDTFYDDIPTNQFHFLLFIHRRGVLR
jgi:hypothetical protein